MTTLELIAHLRSLDIQLQLDGERLRCIAPERALTPEIRQQLTASKAELIDFLRTAHQSLGDCATQVGPRASGAVTPASSGQVRVWLLHQLEGPSHYNCYLVAELRGEVDQAALGRSLAQLAERHETLRTTFGQSHGRLLQIVQPAGDVALERTDLTGRGQALALRHLKARLAEPFDLERGPLWRAGLVDLGQQEYLFYIIIHHIIFDGWSGGPLLRELSAFYEEHRSGQGGSQATLPIQYADYVLWHQGWLAGGHRARLLRYWKRKLAGMPPVLNLPLDKPRPALQSFAGARELLLLSPDLLVGLQQLSRQENATMFMALLAAFQLLLGRYAGTQDVVVGAPAANRTSSSMEQLIGFCVNTLVMRADLSGNPTFRELLARVRELSLEAFSHQELPFADLVEELQPVRSQAHGALFQVFFAFQNYPQNPLKLGDVLDVRYFNLATGLCGFDLGLYLFPTGDWLWIEGAPPEVAGAQAGMVALLDYNTSLFEAATIRRLLQHYRRVLEQVIEFPERPLDELSLLTADEREQMLVEWNRPRTDAPPAPLFVESFERQVRLDPDRIACVHRGQGLSYGELNQRSNRLAHTLHSLGSGPGQLVAICVRRSPEMLVAILAVLKTGAAYLPLTLEYPRQRLQLILDDARPTLVVTQAGELEELPGHPTLLLDEAEPGPAEDLALPLRASDLAYAIYTSGSTGQPKGVLVEHAALASFLQCMRREPGLRADDVLVAVTPITFDIAGLELLLPLTIGARTVIADASAALDPSELADLLERSGATVLQATPITWRMLVDSGWPGRPGLRAWCGGEAFGRELAEALLARTAELWNMYGPTEATIWCSVDRVTSGRGPVLIGRPLANASFYVLDEHRQPVPLGVWGELYVGGPCLARGYLNRSELTAERFVASPFGGPEERLYRTGDRVRYREDGRLEFNGRLDHQVKLRGYRIELGEVEANLREHPSVADCVVSAREEALVAYVVPQPGCSTPPADSLLAFLKPRLPQYMLPSAFVSLVALPVSPNGKVDRQALPDPAWQTRHRETPYLAPATEMERMIADIWKAALRVDRVSRTDNFFDLGGHSLLLIHVYWQLLDKLRVGFPLVDLFEFPSVATLAGHLEGTAVPTPPTASGGSRELLVQRRGRLEGT